MHYHIFSIVYLTCSLVPPAMALYLSLGFPAYGTHNMIEDQSSLTPSWQHTGSDVYTQVPATHPVLNQYKDPQASSPAVVQTQPHVLGPQEPAPMDCEVSLHSSGVEQQQPIHMEPIKSGGDLANSSAGPTAQGAFRDSEMSGDEWTGTLYLNGVCALVRAQPNETVRNPYAHSFVKRVSVLHPRRKLSAWPNHLQLEPVFDSQIDSLDIQAWMDQTKAPSVRLSCRDETDKRQFRQLVGILRSGSGVSRPSSRLPVLAVSRFDSTQL